MEEKMSKRDKELMDEGLSVMVGAWMERDLAGRLGLWCVAFNKSRSEFLREIVEREISRLSTEDLVKRIAKKARYEWNVLKDRKSRRRHRLDEGEWFEQFLNEMKSDLITKGLFPEQIKEIIRVTKELCKES